MHSHSLLVFFCALFSLVAADIQKRSFAVERVKNPNFTGRNGPQALVKTYRKFNMALPQGLLDAMAAQEEKAKAAAAQEKRNAQVSFKYFDRSESARRGLLGDVLNGLGGGNGNKNAGKGNRNKGKNGNRNGKQPGQQPGQGGNPNGGRGGKDNRNGNKGNGGGLNGSRGNQTNTGNNGGRNQGNGTNNGTLSGGCSSANGTIKAPNDSRNQVGNVPAVPEKNDAEFLSPVKIGGQTVNLDFDTGSSDLWVFSKQLDPSITANHRAYDASKSSTFKEMKGATFRIRYGDGSGAEGNVGTDVVDVGGAAFEAQPVELATAVSQQFVMDQNNDGLLGLAFSQINTVKPQKQKTFFDNVKGSLAQPVFTVDLKKNATGTYTFGAIDRSKFQGDLAWIPVNTTKGFWQFSSEKFAVNGEPPKPATAGGQAIADTGTTLILADSKIVMDYYSKVEGAQNNAQIGGFTFPCNAKLPDLALDVGNVYMAKVSGNDINFAQVGDGTCFGGLQATPPGQLGIYGDIFFKSQFVVFNAGNNTLGMAPHV